MRGSCHSVLLAFYPPSPIEEDAMAECEHTMITQLSNVVAETYWQRTSDGTYEPASAAGPVALSRVLEEQTEAWTCDACGAAIAVGGDGRLESR
jgi:hypothetical protein